MPRPPGSRATVRAVVAVCGVLSGASLGGQAPAPDTGVTRSGPATRADSLAELRVLEERLARRSHDPAAWHRKGMLAWGLVDGRRGGEFQSPDVIALTRNADSSLRLAVGQAPDSVRWALDLMTYLLTSHVSSTRSAAWVVARQAVAAAERVGPPALLAEARDAAGMAAWRNYETFEHRPTPRAESIGYEEIADAASDPARRAKLVLKATGDDAHQFSGEASYRQAEQRFRAALTADPSSRSARRHLYMALAERERWEELRHEAGVRVDEHPEDAVSWLCLALAEHRLGDEEAAARDFDRGFGLLPAADRARLTSVTRLLPPKHMPGDTSTAPDSVAYAAASPAGRAAIARRFWADADPLALTAVNEHRNEFYARVIYSELVWSVDELYIRGSETGRGDQLIRYGPPVYILRGMNTTTWMYAYDSIHFATPAGFGVGYFIPVDTAGNDWKSAVSPVRWHDPDAVVPDTVPVQVARFRGAGDSTSIYVAGALPVRGLVEGVVRGSASVDVGFTLVDSVARPLLRDSTRLRLSADDAGMGDVRAWRASIPAGDYRFRVEGLGVANRRAARGSGPLRAAPATGFGVSDLLLAAHVEPVDSTAGARRWTDFVVVPNAGVLRRGAPLALLWESYGMAAGSDSTSRYRVTVSVEPASRGAVADFAARVLAGAAGAVGLRGQSGGDGRVTLAFDRSARARPVVVDYLTLDLGSAPPGAYVVRVTVADSVGGRTAATFRGFRVVE